MNGSPKIYRSLLLLIMLFVSGGVSSTPITPDAGWYGFCFDEAGSPAEAGCQNEGVGVAGNIITFTLLEAGIVKVTDAFDVGDIFDVYIDSLFAFTTSLPGVGANTEDPDIAFSSGYYSAGSAVLAAGAYAVEIFVNSTPFGGGGAYVEVESRGAPVPASGTLALFGLGLAGLGWTRRMRA